MAGFSLPQRPRGPALLSRFWTAYQVALSISAGHASSLIITPSSVLFPGRALAFAGGHGLAGSVAEGEVAGLLPVVGKAAAVRHVLQYLLDDLRVPHAALGAAVPSAFSCPLKMPDFLPPAPMPTAGHREKSAARRGQPTRANTLLRCTKPSK